MEKLPKNIAIDGPASSGKSTIGEIIAKKLDFLYFDTGIMYRAVTLAALQRLSGVNDEKAVTKLAEEVVIDVLPPSVGDGRKSDVLLDGVDVSWDIRKEEVDANVSVVSAYPGVRAAMTSQQRRIGLRGRVVMVGRDIGTVVLPQADLKIYLDASVEERARRRFEEIKGRGGSLTYEKILAGLRQRDQIDSTRSVAPLRPADDAEVIDSDKMSIDEVVAKVMSLIALCYND